MHKLQQLEININDKVQIEIGIQHWLTDHFSLDYLFQREGYSLFHIIIPAEAIRLRRIVFLSFSGPRLPPG